MRRKDREITGREKIKEIISSCDCCRLGFIELDTNHKIYGKDDVACTYTSAFQSIIGTGKVFIVEDYDEKVQGLIEIMKHNTGKAEWQFNEKMVNSVCVFKLEVEELACKEHE